MDISRYLDRLGITAANLKPTHAFLDELIVAHHFHVPFENLDVYDFHRVPLLGVDNLFDKIVTRHRGGYCFEMNGLFFALLKELGFDIWPCLFRINPHGEWGPANHRGTIVRIDGQLHYVDVGMGGAMPPFALPLEASATASSEKRIGLSPWKMGNTCSDASRVQCWKTARPVNPARQRWAFSTPHP